jgi:hypothetical protein
MPSNPLNSSLSSIENNSDGGVDVALFREPEQHNIFKGSHAKTAHALEHNILSCATQYGIERCGILTLTFPDYISDSKEAQRRWNNAARRLLKELFPHMVTVKERHKSGCWHYHVFVVSRADISSGFDTLAYREAMAEGCGPLLHEVADADRSVPKQSEGGGFQLAATPEERATVKMKVAYASAPPHLREVLNELGERLPGLGFGRFEFAPVYSNAEAVAKYLSKQFRDYIGRRDQRDKHVRLVSYTKGARFATTSFSWVESGRSWRKGASRLAAFLTQRGYSVHDLDGLSEVLGSKWGYHMSDVVRMFSRYGRLPTQSLERLVLSRARTECWHRLWLQ